MRRCGVDIINILDRLETLVNSSKKVPYTNSAIIDRKKILDLLDQMRLNIPQEIKEASEILFQKDQIINTAVMEARASKSEAEAEFMSKLNQSALQQKAEELFADADRKTQKQIEQVTKECMAIRIEADSYALKSLRDLEQELTKISGSVRKGIELLAKNASNAQNNVISEQVAVNQAAD